jgi:large conductance mechanosensitive channel
VAAHGPPLMRHISTFKAINWVNADALSRCDRLTVSIHTILLSDMEEPVMGMLNEFKQFAMRGNVVDMAVGIVIGAAFSKIVSSLVSDVIMPPIGKLLGNVDFTDLMITLGSGPKAATLKYGSFLQTVVDFLIVAFAIFMLVKGMNKLTSMTRKPEGPKAPTTKDCPRCCSSIPVKATRCPNCTSDLQMA